MTIESPSFTPQKDFVFISADPTKNAKKTIAPGVTIEIDQRFNPHDKEICTQDGLVKFAPAKLSSKLPVEIKVGDRIFFHHFTCDADNRVEVNNEILYHCAYESVYCKIVDGKIIMLGDYNFIEPLQEEEKSSVIITPDMAKKQSDKKGVIRHMNIRLEEQGVKIGDVILFQKNADYCIDVDGKPYFVIDNKYIVAKEITE